MPIELPTERPLRQEPPPYHGDTSLRGLVIAATLLVSVLGLLCERIYGPTPGYSLAQQHGDLQLSP